MSDDKAKSEIRRFGADFDADELAFASEVNAAAACASKCPSPELIRACEEEVLPQEIAARIRSHMDACPVCGMLRRDTSGFEPADPSSAQLRRMRSVIPPAQVASRERAGMRWWKPTLVFAALAAMIIVTALLKRSEVSPAVPAQQATNQPLPALEKKLFEVAVAKPPIEISSNLLTTRGTSAAHQPTLDEWTTSLKPYKEGDYPSAITAIGDITHKFPQFADGYLYVGVAELLSKKDLEAARNLEHAVKLEQGDRKLETQWYLGAAYARLDRFGDAAAQWEPVCHSKNRFSVEACKEIQQLKSANLH